MAFSTTTRLGIRHPDLAQAADFQVILNNLASDIDAKAVGFYTPGILSARPAAGVGDMIYWATDTKQLYFDDGTTWRTLGISSLVDVLANKPAANTVSSGSRFFATDQLVEYISDGSAWTRLTAIGAVNMQLGASADTGYILLQGQAWPATTGIYADLFGKLGGSTLPDFREFVPVGFKTGSAEFGTLLGTIGEKTHVLTTPELAAHAHVHNAHRHLWLSSPGGGSEVSFAIAAGSSHSYADTMSGPSTGDLSGIQNTTTTEQNAGGGGSHNNIQPSKAVNFQAKL